MQGEEWNIHSSMVRRASSPACSGQKLLHIVQVSNAATLDPALLHLLLQHHKTFLIQDKLTLPEA